MEDVEVHPKCEQQKEKKICVGESLYVLRQHCCLPNAE